MSANEKFPLLVIVGPTAVGKTSLSIQLARQLRGEIISADSMQVYRYLDIGTAKPTPDEQKEAPHHLIDVVNPDQRFTVYDYQKLAQKAIVQVYERGKLPILTGGTGLYIKAVLDQYAFTKTQSDLHGRKELQKEAQKKGKEHLYARLEKIDPEAARRIHPNDLRRVIRALEYYQVTGEPISQQWKKTQEKESPYQAMMVGLNMPRPSLYERIEKRVDQMIAEGLIEEVEGLLKADYNKNLKPLQSLGYRHIINFLEGKWELDETVHYFKRDTRNFAKRQLTWFRADQRIHWYELDPEMKVITHILKAICREIEGNQFTSNEF